MIETTSTTTHHRSAAVLVVLLLSVPVTAPAEDWLRWDGPRGDFTVDGELALARVSPDGVELLGTTTIAVPRAWTLPTLVSTTLCVRDQEKVVALDLSLPPPPQTAE